MCFHFSLAAAVVAYDRFYFINLFDASFVDRFSLLKEIVNVSTWTFNERLPAVCYQFSEAVAVVAYDRFISYDLLDASVMSFLPTLEIKGDLDVLGELCTKYYPFFISQENI